MITCLQGCSLLITQSGTVLRDLDSRQIVHNRFGPPDSIAEVDLIDPDSEEVRRFEVESYHVHAKFSTAMPMGAWIPGMLLMEPYLTCLTIYEAAREIAKGHHLSFVYDEQGNTIGHRYPRPFLERMQEASSTTNVLNWELVRHEGDRQTRAQIRGPDQF
jgi:hypothetical protein